jgi:hypothetical protein
VNRSGLVESKLPELDKILKDASPIESVEGCKVFVSRRSLTFGLPPLGLQAAE